MAASSLEPRSGYPISGYCAVRPLSNSEKKMIATTLAALAIAAANPTVAFETRTPQAVTARLAQLCMDKGFTVLDLGTNQVKCESPLTNVEKGHLLFIKFTQRNYTNDVHHYLAFTVIPAGEGSLVQHRMWIEAMINGSLRSAPLDDRALNSLVEGALTDLGGIVR
jgi:hypothetical protein